MGAAAVRLDDRELKAGDRPHPRRHRHLRELHRAEHPVVVGQRECCVSLLRRLPHQFVEVRRPFQERVVAVRVQLHVGDSIELRRDGRAQVARGTHARRRGLERGFLLRALRRELRPWGEPVRAASRRRGHR